MTLAQSKLTAQGQISVPVEVRRRLGLAPGSVLEWEEQDGQVVVRRAGKYSSEDVRRALFPSRPKARTLDELKDGIRRHMQDRHRRERHARR